MGRQGYAAACAGRPYYNTYVPYWSFGERLSALEELTASPSGINYNLETLAALLAHRLDGTDLLAENRDAFVDGARRLGARSSEASQRSS
jgi:hypothetical protein